MSTPQREAKPPFPQEAAPSVRNAHVTSLATFKRFSRIAVVYLGITAVTLVLLDVTMMATGLFPPTYDYGVLACLV